MPATFIHLSGSKRGQVETRAAENITIGSGKGPGTFVNHRMAPEIILQDGEILGFGEGGPKVRFRIRPEDQPCKPFRDICADCFDLTLLGGKDRLVAFPSFLRTMLQGIYRDASWKVRVSVVSIFFLMIGSIVGSPLLLYKSYLDRLHYEKSLLGLSAEMQSDRLSQTGLEKRLLEAREQLTHYRTETEAALTRLRQERDRLETQLQDPTDIAERGDARIRDLESKLSVATREIHDLEREERAGESVLQRDMGGVAFLSASPSASGLN